MKLAIFSCVSGFKIVNELDSQDTLKSYPEDLTIILEEDIEVLNYQPFFIGFQTDRNQRVILGDGRLQPYGRKTFISF